MCTHLQVFLYAFVVMVTLFYRFNLCAAVWRSVDMSLCGIHLNIASDNKIFMLVLSLITSCDWQLFMVLWPCTKNPHPPTHHWNNANLTKSVHKVWQADLSALWSSPTYTVETLECRDNEAEISHDSNYVVERMFQTWCFLVICAFTFITPHSR